MIATVYRIQDKDQRGCYITEKREKYPFLDEMDKRHSDDTTGHPILHVSYDIPYRCIRFAFSNLAQVRNWFTAYERKELAKLGYKLVKIELDVVKDDGYQVYGYLPNTITLKEREYQLNDAD